MNLDKQDKLEQLDNVLQSRTFHGSENLRAFLRYVVTKTVESDASSLKEYTIASEVFGQNGYDPRIDSTVRVQASRLRNKLHEYYATEGRRDCVIIELPKGHYTPTFSFVEKREVHIAPDSPVAPYTESPTNGHASLPAQKKERFAETVAITEQITFATAKPIAAPKQSRWLMPLMVICATLAGVTLWLGYALLKYRAEARQADSLSLARIDPIGARALSLVWGGFLNSSQPILISYSNTLFERRPDLTLKSTKPLVPGESNSDPSIKQAPTETTEAAGQSGSAGLGSEIDVVDYYTGVGEVMGASALSKFFTKSGHPFRVRRSLLLNWDDVKNENIVMLGSPAENLLLRNLPQAQDFEFRFNKELRLIELINLRPLPGEESVYRPKIERVRNEGPTTLAVKEDYALVSLLKGLGEQNKLLILAGITTHGTHAAAEYVTKPEYVKELINHLGGAETSGAAAALPASYQLVLKIKVNGGVPVQMTYVTHHELKN